MSAQYAVTTYSLPSGTTSLEGTELGRLFPNEVVEPTGVRERFALTSVGDVWEQHEPLEYLIDGLIPEASVSQFVGDGGSKKTWALIDMAVCVALGDDWLGFPLKQSGVLWIDEENGSHRMRRRLYMALNGHLVKPGTDLPIHFTCLNGANFRNTEGVDNDVNKLHVLIEQTRAGLVVIDPQVNVTGGAKENSAEEMQPFFANLKKVADATGAAIVIIHHNNKNGDYRGSTAIKGAVDVMIGVESKPDSDFINFKNNKVRDDKVGNFSAVATWQQEKEQFSLSASEPKEKSESKDKMGKPKRYVLRYLLEHGNSQLKEIKDNADTCAPTSARDAVYDLTDERYVKRTDDGNQLQAEYDLTAVGRQLAGTLK
jgi:hypothetical protein